MKVFCVSLVILAFLSVFPGTTRESTGAAIASQPTDGARRITPADLLPLFNKGQAVIVDVRSEEAYKAGHIKGAWLIPASDINHRADELPRDKLIATYCA